MRLHKARVQNNPSYIIPLFWVISIWLEMRTNLSTFNTFHRKECQKTVAFDIMYIKNNAQQLKTGEIPFQPTLIHSFINRRVCLVITFDYSIGASFCLHKLISYQKWQLLQQENNT